MQLEQVADGGLETHFDGLIHSYTALKQRTEMIYGSTF